MSAAGGMIEFLDPESLRGAAPMALEIVQPDGLDKPKTYSHVIATTGSRLVFIAGQMSDDPQGNLVAPGDLAAQARQVFANLDRALAAAGARPDQVAGCRPCGEPRTRGTAALPIAPRSR